MEMRRSKHWMNFCKKRMLTDGPEVISGVWNKRNIVA